MFLVWWPFVWKSFRLSGEGSLPSLHPGTMALLAVVLVAAATAGGWLVYGPHAIPFPLK